MNGTAIHLACLVPGGEGCSPHDDFSPIELTTDDEGTVDIIASFVEVVALEVCRAMRSSLLGEGMPPVA